MPTIAQALRAAELFRDIAHDQDLVAALHQRRRSDRRWLRFLPPQHPIERFLSPLGSLAQHPAIFAGKIIRSSCEEAAGLEARTRRA